MLIYDSLYREKREGFAFRKHWQQQQRRLVGNATPVIGMRGGGGGASVVCAQACVVMKTI